MQRKGERREKGEKPDGKWCACTPQGHWGQTSRDVASQPLEKGIWNAMPRTRPRNRRSKPSCEIFQQEKWLQNPTIFHSASSPARQIRDKLPAGADTSTLFGGNWRYGGGDV